MLSIQTDMECTVVISKFESFNKFYVQKVEDDKYSSANVKSNNRSTSVATDKSRGLIQRPLVGSIIETLTDKADGVWYKAEVMAMRDGSNIIVRVLNDGSVCKSTKIKYPPDNGEKLVYLCCLDDSEEDDLTNDPYNFNIISNIMTSREWTMKTSSIREPYKVSLSINGEDCFNVICKFLPLPDIGDTASSNLSPSVDGSENNDTSIIEEKLKNVVAEKNGLENNDAPLIEEKAKNVLTKKTGSENNDALIIKENPKNEVAKENGPENNDALIIKENPKNELAKENGTENDLVTPHSEMVTIRNFETVKSFQTKSECLYTLYMERINTELKMCKTQKRVLKKNRVGSVVVAFSNGLDACYRVLVESITSFGTNCYLLDYGEYDVFREFYRPTDFLRTCPPIVRRCSLYAPNLDGKEDEIWFRDVDDMFKDIVTIDGIKFDMIIKKDESWKDPCVVSLMLENVDISEMLFPVNVRVTHVNSLTDFKVKATADEQRFVTELLESENIPKVIVENPVHGGLYLAESDSKLTRVRFDSLDGVYYRVNDIDDTLDYLLVHELYEIPDDIKNIPPSTMACSFIFDDHEDAYSLDAFKCLADERAVFIMNIINENEFSIKPNLVKLYYAHKDVLTILKL